jgi:hypothetical protein
VPGEEGVQFGMGEGCWANPYEEAETKAAIARAEPLAFQCWALRWESEVQESGRREPDRGAIDPSQNSVDALV